MKKDNLKSIAILSPSKDFYSETFIKAHKDLLDGNIHYLYGGSIPTISEYTNTTLFPKSFIKEFLFHLKYNYCAKEQTKSQFALKNYLKRHKIKCVLAEYGTTGAETFNVCMDLNIPLIVHFHGYDASVNELIEKYKIKYKEMFAYSSFIVGVSKVMIKKLEEIGATKDKLVYNPCAPNDSFLSIDRQPNNKILFFGAGRFVDKKAPYYTLFAFSKVIKKHPNALLVIGGDGPLKEAVENIARVIGLENNVQFPGTITPGEVKAYLTKATAYVQHSIKSNNGDMEGTPVGVLEASAAGVPVISTYHAGIPDVIIHKKSGLLCEEHDYNKMAEYMMWVIENKEAALLMGQYGRKHVKENFSMHMHIEKLNIIIDKAMNE